MSTTTKPREETPGGEVCIDRRGRTAVVSLDTLGYLPLDAYEMSQWTALEIHARARCQVQGVGRLARRDDGRVFGAARVYSTLRCLHDDVDAVVHAVAELPTSPIGWWLSYLDLLPGEPASAIRRPRHKLWLTPSLSFADRRSRALRRKYPALPEFDVRWGSGMVRFTKGGWVELPMRGEGRAA